jgi:hypothetical protein
MRLPDALQRRMPNTHLLRHHPYGPVRGILGHDLWTNVIGNALLACSWTPTLYAF